MFHAVLSLMNFPSLSYLLPFPLIHLPHHQLSHLYILILLFNLPLPLLFLTPLILLLSLLPLPPLYHLLLLYLLLLNPLLPSLQFHLLVLLVIKIMLNYVIYLVFLLLTYHVRVFIVPQLHLMFILCLHGLRLAFTNPKCSSLLLMMIISNFLSPPHLRKLSNITTDSKPWMLNFWLSKRITPGF